MKVYFYRRVDFNHLLWYSRLVGFIFIFSSSFIQAQPGDQILIASSNNSSPYGYLQYLPEDYDETGTGHPLIVFLHGFGEMGDGSQDSLVYLFEYGPPKLINNGGHFPAVVLSPQTPIWWEVNDIDDFLDHAITTYNIDPNRIYFTGVSMGGGGVWRYASRYADKLAAIVPICGAAQVSRPYSLVDLPIWTFHDSADEVVDIANTDGWVSAIEELGGSPIYTVYENNNENNAHDSWTITYNNQEVWDWLFEQQRNTGGITITEITVSPNTVLQDMETPVSIKAKIQDHDGGISSVQVDLSEIGGSSTMVMNPIGDDYYELIYTTPKNQTLGKNNIEITAVDLSGSTHTVSAVLNVNPDNARFYYNFNMDADEVPGWNNGYLSTLPTYSWVFSALKDEFGMDQGVQIMNEKGFTDYFNAGAQGDGSLYPDDVSEWYFYVRNADKPTILRIEGLDPGLHYNFKLFGSSTYSDTDGSTYYDLYGESQQSSLLYVVDNTKNCAFFHDFVPDEEGVVRIELGGSGSNGGFINALEIQSYIDGSPPTGLPTNVRANPHSSTEMMITWDDDVPNAKEFIIYRVAEDGISQHVGTVEKNDGFFIDSGLNPFTMYEYKVAATNEWGQSEFVTSTKAYTYVSSLFINFSEGQEAPEPWNNTLVVPGEDDVYENLDDDRKSYTASIEVSGTWGGTNTEDGVTEKGIYPAEVLNESYYFGYHTDDSEMNLSINGLEDQMEYKVDMMASNNWNGNTLTYFTIDGETKQHSASGNTRELASFEPVSPINGYINVRLNEIEGSGSIAGFLTALAVHIPVDETFSETLEAPSGFNVTLNGENKPLLSWSDVDNEYGYEIRRRNIEVTDFEIIAIAPFNATSYVDVILAEGEYEYQIRALHAVTTSTYNTTTIAAPNAAPTLTSVLDNVVVKDSESLQLTLTAVDPEGERAIIAASDLPDFVSFRDNGDGTASIGLNPGKEDIGSYTITIKLEDELGNSITYPWEVKVKDQRLTSVFVNFGQNIPAAYPWNNVMGEPYDDMIFANLIDENGDNSGITITLNDWEGVYNEGDDRSDEVFPAEVLKEYYFVGAFDEPNSAKITVDGLSPSYVYNFAFVGSTLWSNEPTASYTDYIIQDQISSLAVYGNTSESAQIGGLTDISGTLEIEMAKGANSRAAYINGMIIEYYKDEGIPFEPVNLKVAATSINHIDLTWTDKASNETGFEIYMSLSRDHGYTLVNTVPAGETYFRVDELEKGTTYYFKARAIGSYGDSGFTTPVKWTTAQYEVAINFEHYASATEWNDITSTSANVVFDGFLDGEGEDSGMSIQFLDPFEGSNDLGKVTGDDSGVYPDEVMQDFFYFGFSNSASQTVRVSIEGLTPQHLYNLEFFASSVFDNTDDGVVYDNGSTIYEAGGQSASLNVQANTTETAIINGVQPDQNGHIVVTMSKGSNAPGYINAMKILSIDPALNEERTFYAIADGDWNDPSTWSTTNGGQPDGNVPGINDFVHIDGHQVALSDQSSECAGVNIWVGYPNTAMIVQGQGAKLTVHGRIVMEGSQKSSGKVISVLNGGEIECVE